MKNRAICILGMHRSGTSAITRAINLLGVYLGEEKDIFPALDYNPEGIWERIDFNGLQERLLAAIKRAWDTGLPLPDRWQDAPEVRPFRDEIVSLIKANFSGIPLWAWKDPRSTIFIELWKESLKELGIELSAVFAVRNPLDVARSLQKRDGFSLDKGFGIWFNYNIVALRAIKYIPTVFISYDKFVSDWEVELRRVAEGLGIGWPENDASLREKMNSFIRPDLRHSSSTGEDLKIAEAPQPVIELYALLQRLLAGEALDSSENSSSVQRLWDSFYSYARFYQNDMTELWDRKEALTLREIQLSEKERQLVELAVDRERQLAQKDQQLLFKDQQLEKKDGQLVEKDRQLSEKDRQLVEKDRQLVEKDRQLSEKDRVPAPCAQYLIERDRQLAERELRINDLLNSWSWKVTAPLRRVYELLFLGTDGRRGGKEKSEKVSFAERTKHNISRILRTYDFKQAIPNIRRYGLSTFLQNAGRELFGIKSKTGVRISAGEETLHPGRREEKAVSHSAWIDKLEIFNGTVDVRSPLIFPETSGPLVSIVIPVHNKWEYTYGCLYSILENSKDIPYEIIVADDASTDETKSIRKYVSGVKTLRNETNLGFLKNCNIAAKKAEGKYILFLNNDTNVQKDWLRSLLDLIEKDATIGMTGGKLVYANGWLQEAGGVIWCDASGINYGRLDDPDKPEYNYVKDVDYISGACIMIRKELWEETGGFDERFSPAYYEDTDLAFSVRQRGYRVVFQPKSVVVHFEGVSHGTDLNSGIKSYQVRNREIFYEKWKEVLQKEHFANEDDLFLARDRSGTKKTILFIDYEVPRFDMFAGSRTNYMYLRLLVDLGLNVKFMSADFNRVEPYASVLEEAGIEVLCGDWYHENWRNWIADNGGHIKYVLVNKPDTAEMFIDEIRLRTGAVILYQGHDLHFLRLMRSHETENSLKTLKEAEYYKKLEHDIFNKSDVILTFSEVEKKIIEEAVPHKKVIAVPLFFYDEVSMEPLDFHERRDIMFVGGFAHRPNGDAVSWFCKNVFPLILRRLPDIKFRVVGSSPSQELRKLSSRNVEIVGRVSDEELERLYAQTKLVVIPLRFGAGVKGKLIEAMHKGIPVVSTSIGVEGIENIESLIGPRDSEADFADEVVSLYNSSRLEEISKSYLEFIRDHFSRKKAGQIMSDCLDDAARSHEDTGVAEGLLVKSSDDEAITGATARLIAFYLPQYHPIPENDEWWGKGFTEWRNVVNAKPQFPGHQQPRLPGELGFYDLRLPEVRKAQADLAREYGIEGFCYYHYWFNGKLLLERPLHEMLESGEPDFPFCLCWANEDWTRAWDGRSGQVLLGQNYNDGDDLEHLRYLLRFFKDRRYIRVNGRPLLLVYRASLMPNPLKTAERWRAEARKHGIEDLYLCRVESFPEEHADPNAIGFDASIEFQPDWDNRGTSLSIENEGGHSIYEYSEIVRRMMSKPVPPYKRFPGVCPSWDNSPRRKKDAIMFINSSPELYENWLRFAVKKVQGFDPDERIVFINAWNEWAEGNYLEPDLLNGRRYLEATRRALNHFRKKLKEGSRP